MNEQISQIIREAITDLIDEGTITQEDLRQWFKKGGWWWLGQIWFIRTKTR